MTTFLKWWLIFISSLTAVALAGLTGFLQSAWANDSTKLPFLIVGLYFVMSVFIGRLTYQAVRGQTDGAISSQHLLAYLPEMMTCLGLLGAVGGFAVALTAFAHIDVANISAVQASLQKMTYGVSFAVQSTFVGILSAVLLTLQTLNLKHQLGELETE